MAASMPYGLPSLTTDSYESIAAYILEANGAPAGEQPYGATTSVAIDSVIAPRK